MSKIQDCFRNSSPVILIGNQMVYSSPFDYTYLLHLSRALDVINYLKKKQRKFLKGARENKCQISQNYILHMKFPEFYPCFHNSCEIWHLFSQAPIRNFLWCYHRSLITLLGLEIRKKECTII